MATTWAATANNQAVTRQALQDAINTNALNFGTTFIPTTDITKCVNSLDAVSKYSYIDYPPAYADNKILVKDKFIVKPSYEYGISIGGKRDGADVDILVTLTSPNTIFYFTLTEANCKLFGTVGGYISGTVTISVNTLSNQPIKFWMTEGGVACPTGGTQYDSYVYTPASKRNFLIVPVWTGSSYVLV